MLEIPVSIGALLALTYSLFSLSLLAAAFLLAAAWLLFTYLPSFRRATWSGGYRPPYHPGPGPPPPAGGPGPYPPGYFWAPQFRAAAGA
jgi:hypothetical protein